MEALTLASFSKWCPHSIAKPDRTSILKICGPGERVKPGKRETKAISNFPLNQLPFASKSIAVVQADFYGDKNKRIGIYRVFETCGSLLTSLSIKGKSFNRLCLQQATIIGILSQTPNLKALHMSCLEISGSTSKTPLPALPHLKTFLICSVRAYYLSTRNGDMDVTSCFFETYTPQLVTLEIGTFSEANPPVPLRSVQKNLKQLTLHNPSRNFLVKSVPAPLLQRLAISGKSVFTKDDFQNVFGLH